MMNSLNVHLFDLLTNQGILMKGLFPKSEEAKDKVPDFASEFITLLKTQGNDVKNSIAFYMKTEGLHLEAMKELVQIYCEDLSESSSKDQEPKRQPQMPATNAGPGLSDNSQSNGKAEDSDEDQDQQNSSSKRLKIELMSLERLEKSEKKKKTRRVLVYLEILIITTRDDDQVLRELLESFHQQKLAKVVEEILKSPDNSTHANSY